MIGNKIHLVIKELTKDVYKQEWAVDEIFKIIEKDKQEETQKIMYSRIENERND